MVPVVRVIAVQEERKSFLNVGHGPNAERKHKLVVAQFQPAVVAINSFSFLLLCVTVATFLYCFAPFPFSAQSLKNSPEVRAARFARTAGPGYPWPYTLPKLSFTSLPLPLLPFSLSSPLYFSSTRSLPWLTAPVAAMPTGRLLTPSLVFAVHSCTPCCVSTWRWRECVLSRCHSFCRHWTPLWSFMVTTTRANGSLERLFLKLRELEIKLFF